MKVMQATNNERNSYSPQMGELMGKTTGAWCLCPAWMGWMPWLVDGVEVLREQGKRREGNSSSHHRQAGLNG